MDDSRMTSKSGLFWIPITIGDILSHTQNLTNEQFAILHKLIYHQWLNGHFSETEMAAIAGFSGSIFEDSGESASSSASSTAQAQLKHLLSKCLAPIKKLLSQDADGLWFDVWCDAEKAKRTENKRVFVERARKGGIAKERRRQEKLAASSSASSTSSSNASSNASSDKKLDIKAKAKTPPTPTPTPGAGAGDESKTNPSRQAGTSKSETRAKPGEKPAAARLNGGGAGKVQASSKEGVAGPGEGGARASNFRSDPENAGPAAENPGSVNQAKFSGESKTEIFRFWDGAGIEQYECPWSHLEDRALKDFINANPKVDLLGFRQLLRNRAASEGINRADPPHKWLRSLVKYADGPLDRFGKPLRPVRVH
jgi:hypothetical protein